MTDQPKSFVTVCKTAELPEGEHLVVELGRKWIVIFNVGGEYYALEDMCSHEEVPLSEGELDGYSIECHQHGACFDVRTGAVLAPPAFAPVKRFAVRVEGDDVQIETK
jgi:3-phenylpropionate/trans-cinnamate dioxygenase ferredoxin component